MNSPFLGPSVYLSINIVYQFPGVISSMIELALSNALAIYYITGRDSFLVY
nr:MAG TPA: hypothetical protein [Caudoviricetes sp.]